MTESKNNFAGNGTGSCLKQIWFPGRRRPWNRLNTRDLAAFFLKHSLFHPRMIRPVVGGGGAACLKQIWFPGRLRPWNRLNTRDLAAFFLKHSLFHPRMIRPVVGGGGAACLKIFLTPSTSLKLPTGIPLPRLSPDGPLPTVILTLTGLANFRSSASALSCLFRKPIAQGFFKQRLSRRPVDFFFGNQQMPLPRRFRRAMPPDQMSIAPAFPFAPGRGRRRFASGQAPLDRLLFFQPAPAFAQRFL